MHEYAVGECAKLSPNALTGEVKSGRFSMSGKATNQDLAPWSNDKFRVADHRLTT